MGKLKVHEHSRRAVVGGWVVGWWLLPAWQAHRVCGVLEALEPLGHGHRQLAQQVAHLVMTTTTSTHISTSSSQRPHTSQLPPVLSSACPLAGLPTCLPGWLTLLDCVLKTVNCLESSSTLGGHGCSSASAEADPSAPPLVHHTRAHRASVSGGSHACIQLRHQWHGPACMHEWLRMEMGPGEGLTD